MASVNRVTLLGNVGREPELKYASSGVAMCNISIATSTKRKDKTTGDYTEETQWHRVQFYDRLAEIVGEYVKKGSSVYIEGRLKYGKYTNKDGAEVNTCDIVAESMQLLGGKQDGQQQQRPEAPRPAAPQQAAPAKARAASSGFEDMDDDIPFRNPMHSAALCLVM